MSELDDLFRQQFDGHASEPSPDLWARLQARPAAEGAEGAAPPAADPLDAQFRAGLAEHATPPRRELWERLEDEHLRPRQRRRPVVAWGRLAVAASLLLLLLAGGAGRWWSTRHSASGPVMATTGRRPAGGPRASVADAAATPEGTEASNTPAAVATTSARALATASSAVPAAAPAAAGQAIPTTAAGPRRAEAAWLAAQTDSHQKNRKILATQATGSGASPSSSSVASIAARPRPATVPPVPGHLPTTPQPDAAANTQLALGGRKTPGGQPTIQPEAPALAAAPPQIIEVEVRRGSRSAPAEAPVVAAAPAASEAAEPRRRLRLGGLLRQASHALRGEQVSLAEATGLPETVTVQAHLGDRVLSRTIRL